MDRNFACVGVGDTDFVALRKESVDRNSDDPEGNVGFFVALRKESVDRNHLRQRGSAGAAGSLSARRAWIEMETMLPSWDRYASRSPQGERG